MLYIFHQIIIIFVFSLIEHYSFHLDIKTPAASSWRIESSAFEAQFLLKKWESIVEVFHDFRTGGVVLFDEFFKVFSCEDF